MSPRRKNANGEGSVYWSDGHKRYVAAYTVDGKRRIIYGPRDDRSREARLALEERLSLKVGRTPNDDTVGALVARYIAGKRAELAPKTIAGYEDAVKHINGSTSERHPRPADPISHMRVTDLTPLDVRDFYDRMETGETMRLKVHVLLHAALQMATDLEIIDRNPCAKRGLKPKPRRKPIEIWQPQHVAAFLASPVARAHRLYAYFVLALTTTMGPAELAGLQKRDVDLRRGVLLVDRNVVTVAGKLVEGDVKTKFRRREIALPGIAIAALRKRFEAALAEGNAANPYVFTAPEGGPIRPENMRRREWYPLIDAVNADNPKAKLPRTHLYALRHTAKSIMNIAGISLEHQQRRMGHSSIKTTSDVYGMLYDAAIADDVRRLDTFFDTISAEVKGA